MHDGFVSPTQWIAWLNTESRALELFVVRSGWIEPQATTVDAVNFAITIPNPLAVIGVYEVRDGQYRVLKYQSQVDFTKQLYSSPNITGDANYYTILSSSSSDDLTVHLHPKPTVGIYRCLYMAGAVPATAVTDSTRWPMGFEERLVLGMARRALVKENSDTQQVETLIAEQDRTIEAFCWSRNIAESPTIRNVDRAKRGWQSDMMYGPYESWYWL
jgi:hypothetical protein